MPIRIFVSHNSKDRELVKLFVRVLEAALQIEEGEIRCTSLPGYRLRSGSHSSTALRKEINEASLIIGVLTPNSVESGWVMFELGAGWGSRKWVVPVIAGIDYDSMPGPLKESSATDAATRGELEQLFEEISTTLSIRKRAAGRASDLLDELIAEAEEYYEDDDEEEDDEEEEGNDDDE